MIITGGVIGAALTLATYRYTNRFEIAEKKRHKKEELKFKNKWKLAMQYAGIKNKNEQTFTVLKYIPKDSYGCDAIISIPLGKSYSDLYKLIPMLETTFGAKIISEIASTSKNCAYIRVAYDLSNASNKDRVRFIWNRIMASDDKLRNQNDETFKLANINEQEEYGYDLLVEIPDGLNPKILESIKTTLETNFRGKVYMRTKSFDNKLEMTVVEKELPDDYKFVPVQCGVEELYLGMTYYYKPTTINLKVLSHMMYSGNTNTGKTVCLMTALTNHIYWHDETKWDLFLSMISAKKDLKIFANVKQCKYFADNLEKAYLMFKHLWNIMHQRNQQFETDSTIMNLYDWNKKYPRRRMKPIIVATDEISFFMSSDLDKQNEKTMKDECRALMWELLKEGRNCGIHFLSCLQRPDTLSFPAPMKALIGAKACFYQPNTASSLVVLDTTEATELRKQREAIVDGEEKELMKTVFLTPEMIQEYIKHREEPNHKHLNLENQPKEETTKDNKSEKPTETKKSTKSKETSPKPNNKQSTFKLNKKGDDK